MIVTALLIVAIILALVEELRVRGEDLVGWACVIGFAALLWGRVG